MFVTLLKLEKSPIMNLADCLYTRSILSMSSSTGVRGPDRVDINILKINWSYYGFNLI